MCSKTAPAHIVMLDAYVPVAGQASPLTDEHAAIEELLATTACYRPPPSSLPITLIKAIRRFPRVQCADRQVSLELGHPSNGWDSARFPRLRKVDIDADHFNMMSSPAVNMTADIVREDLRLAASRG